MQHMKLITELHAEPSARDESSKRLTSLDHGGKIFFLGGEGKNQSYFFTYKAQIDIQYMNRYTKISWRETSRKENNQKGFLRR